MTFPYPFSGPRVHRAVAWTITSAMCLLAASTAAHAQRGVPRTSAPSPGADVFLLPITMPAGGDPRIGAPNNLTRRDGYDNAIVLNSAGSVAEGPNACIFLVRDGEVITPHLQSGILESITRDAVLTMVRAGLELPMYERAVDRTEIYLADELFFVGNAAEITPVTQVDGQTIGDGAIGPVTRRLRAGLKAIARGTTPEHAAWRTAVGLPVPALA